MRLVIVDPHDMVRDGLVRSISAALPGARFVYAGAGVRDAAAVIGPGRCDCVILDPIAGGEGREIQAVAEVATLGVPVVAVGAVPRGQEAAMERACLTAGARAFVSKRQDVRRLVIAIRTAAGQAAPVAAGRSSSHARGARPVAGGGGITLSAQEQRALVLYASGLTLPQVALRMHLAPSTVKQYLDRVRVKGTSAGRVARTKTDLYHLARVQGLMP